MAIEAGKRERSEFFFGHYVVGVVDILGQSQAMEKMDFVPSSEEDMARYIEVVKHSLGIVLRTRDQFKRFYKKFLEHSSDASTTTGLSEEQRRALAAYKAADIDVQMFADTIVPYSLISTPNRPLTVHGTYGIICGIGALMTDAMSQGIALRGAIDVGVCTEIECRDIYGAALARGHHLESKVAQYPRIVVGKGLVRFIRSALNNPDPSELGVINRMMADVVRRLVCVDQDGVRILDYLGETMREITKEPELVALAQKAFGFVVAEQERLSEDPKLGPRYWQLKNYFEARMHLWQ